MTNILDQNAKNLDILKKTKKPNEIKKLIIYNFFPFYKLSFLEMKQLLKNDLVLKKRKSNKNRQIRKNRQSKRKKQN